jgi:hypothetical protein
MLTALDVRNLLEDPALILVSPDPETREMRRQLVGGIFGPVVRGYATGRLGLWLERESLQLFLYATFPDSGYGEQLTDGRDHRLHWVVVVVGETVDVLPMTRGLDPEQILRGRIPSIRKIQQLEESTP